MSQLLDRNIEFLTQLKEASAEDAQKLIAESSDENILALTELAVNILQGKLDLKVDTYLKLKVHTELLRKLAKKSVSTKSKRRWLVRSIDLLPLLVGPLFTCISSCLVRSCVENSAC